MCEGGVFIVFDKNVVLFLRFSYESQMFSTFIHNELFDSYCSVLIIVYLYCSPLKQYCFCIIPCCCYY